MVANRGERRGVWRSLAVIFLGFIAYVVAFPVGILGLVGVGIGVNSTFLDNGPIKCGDEVMGPGNVCTLGGDYYTKVESRRQLEREAPLYMAGGAALFAAGVGIGLAGRRALGPDSSPRADPVPPQADPPPPPADPPA